MGGWELSFIKFPARAAAVSHWLPLRNQRSEVSQPEIDFARIRPVGGSRTKGFEELCCQLASLEPAPPGAVFRRTGEGADGGVECFRLDPDGSEIGWQAKYVFELKSSQIWQIDESLTSALTHHPALKTYVVCVPIDLHDGRRPDVKTQLKRFEDWREKRIAEAKAAGRTLDIELWQAHTLLGRLTTEGPQFAGKRLYWFDERLFTPLWFGNRLSAPLADLHDRYQPENHVDVALQNDLRGLVRSPDLLTEPESWADRLAEALYDAIGSTPTRLEPPLEAGLLAETGRALLDLFLEPLQVWDEVPIRAWDGAAQDVASALTPLLDAAWAPGADKALEDWGRKLYALKTTLDDIVDEWSAGPWALINSRQLLVFGEGGAGKSHLVAGFVKRRLEQGYPTLIALGGGLREADPWRQLMEAWDLPAVPSEEALAALETAAEAAGGPALIVIDALNEGAGPALWRTRLKGFLTSLQRHPKIVTILTCRSTYIHAMELDRPVTGLARIRHEGFAGEDEVAAYLERRGVHGPGLPELGPELSSPLFLKTCCDLLERTCQTAFPRGLRGVTAIFDFYIEAIQRALEAKLGLDELQQIPKRAIKALADALSVAPGGRLSLAEATAVFDAILPSGGQRDRSLLNQFVSEGVLSIEMISRGERAEQSVRITFERFSDHLIASRLLEGLDAAQAEDSVRSGELAGKLFGDRSWHWAGVHEALAVQLPERFGLELPDLRPDVADLAQVRPAFRDSLLWRDPAAFTQRTLDLLGSEREQLSVLLHVASDPTNRFNADFLDRTLRAMPRPDRDAIWSTLIAVQGLKKSRAAPALIAWGRSGAAGAEPERVRLGAIALCWLFTTSHRAVRDRATKALAALLHDRLDVAGDLVERFMGLDDLYVSERVLAAAYAAATRSSDAATVGRLADKVWRNVFAGGAPPLHLLLRDYAAGIIEHGAHLGALAPSIDASKAHGPFTSDWPLEEVSPSDIARFGEYASDQPYWGAIQSSCSDHGDFGRYVIEHRSRHWSQRPLRDAGLGAEDLWLRFVHSLDTAEKAEALLVLKKATLAAKQIQAPYNAPPKEKAREAKAQARVKAAKTAFERSLNAQQLQDWRTAAEAVYRSGFNPAYANLPSLELQPFRRWVTKRAYDLGWTPERFEEFERGGVISHDRMTHTVERIGKKYQWLALHEALARASDNVAPLKGRSHGPLSVYDGAWATDLRDIDPTLQVSDMAGDQLSTWWTPIAPTLRARKPSEAMAWLNSDEDRLSDRSMIEVRAPDGMDYWMLHGFVHARASRSGARGTAEPSAWARIDAVFVRTEDRQALLKVLENEHWPSSHDLPAYESEMEAFVGELAWRLPYMEWDEWFAGPRRKSDFSWAAGKRAPEIKRGSFEYVAEQSTFDTSLDGDVRVQLPAPWLVKAMDLTLMDPRTLVYSGPGGERTFFDPSVSEPGFSAALVDKAAMVDLLQRECLDIVWVISGEKSVYASSREGWGGDRMHTSVFRRDGDQLVSQEFDTRQEPSAKQLQALFATSDETDDDDDEDNDV